MPCRTSTAAMATTRSSTSPGWRPCNVTSRPAQPSWTWDAAAGSRSPRPSPPPVTTSPALTSARSRSAAPGDSFPGPHSCMPTPARCPFRTGLSTPLYASTRSSTCRSTNSPTSSRESPPGSGRAGCCWSPPAPRRGPAPKTTGSVAQPRCGGATLTPTPTAGGSLRPACASNPRNSFPRATAATNCSGHSAPTMSQGAGSLPAVTDLGFLDSTRSSYDAVAAGYSAFFAAQLPRVLATGAPLMLAFQVGDGPQHFTEAWGYEVDLILHRRRPETVTAMLTEAGFHILVTMVHEPADTPTKKQGAFLIALKPK